MSFDPGQRYRISPAVTLRPEPFGALAYHFGQRRLTYLAATDLVAVLDEMQDERTAADAMAAVGVPAERRPSIQHALANLLERGVLDVV
jgi:mycofactocin biosynthesis protein MftB